MFNSKTILSTAICTIFVAGSSGSTAVGQEADGVGKKRSIAQANNAVLRAEAAARTKEATVSNKEVQRLRIKIAEMAKAAQEMGDAFQAEVAAAEKRVAQQRLYIVALRQRLRERDGHGDVGPGAALSEQTREYGVVTTVDDTRMLCSIYVDASADLSVSSRFYVYSPGNQKRLPNDIVGVVEVVEILSPKRATARVVSQKNAGRPIDSGDVLDLPIFRGSMEALEIVIAGQIHANGLNRQDFRRLVQAVGAEVSVEVTDEGVFVNGEGLRLEKSKALEKVTQRTRFIVICDLENAESDTSKDAKLRKSFQENCEELRRRATAIGVELLTVSSFLERIGYSRRQRGWTPDQPFPSRLPKGSR